MIRFSRIARFVVPFLFLGAVVYSQIQYLALSRASISSNNVAEDDKLTTELLVQGKFPAVGFDNLIADWLFLGFIQYFGDEEARLKTGYGVVPDYFDAISTRDPRFLDAFLMLSTANSIYAGQPQKTVEFLDKALRFINPGISPKAQYLWYYKGIDEMLFLSNLKSAKHSFEMASQWAKETGEETTAQRAQEIINFLNTNPDTNQAKIAGWSLVLNNATDPKTQQYALGQLKQLGVRIRVNPNGQIMIESPPDT
jgi:hypothetical protein